MSPPGAKLCSGCASLYDAHPGRSTGNRLQIEDCRLQIHGLAIEDCRFGLTIADWIANRQSAMSIGNRQCQSAIGNRQRQSGGDFVDAFDRRLEDRIASGRRLADLDRLGLVDREVWIDAASLDRMAVR